MKAMVEKTAQRVAKFASLWYQAAKMAAVAPTGMPPIRLLTFKAVCSIPRMLSSPKTAAGEVRMRNRLKRKVSFRTIAHPLYLSLYKEKVNDMVIFMHLPFILPFHVGD